MSKQMERSFFPSRLYDSFKKVKASRLVNRHEVDDDSVKHFEHYMNTSQPQTEREFGAREIIRACFQEIGYKHFFRLIKKNKMECTILYLDPRSIVTYLNLIGLVYLSADEDSGAFNVVPIAKPPLNDVLAFPPISWIEDAEEYIKERDRRMSALVALKADIVQLDSFITQGICAEEETKKDLENTLMKAKDVGQCVELAIASGVVSQAVDEAVENTIEHLIEAGIVSSEEVAEAIAEVEADPIE